MLAQSCRSGSEPEVVAAVADQYSLAFEVQQWTSKISIILELWLDPVASGGISIILER
jgi:hypothetical protein